MSCRIRDFKSVVLPVPVCPTTYMCRSRSSLLMETVRSCPLTRVTANQNVASKLAGGGTVTPSLNLDTALLADRRWRQQEPRCRLGGSKEEPQPVGSRG